MPDIGDYNERLVLQTIRRAGTDGMSQVEVVERSGLSRQAVSVIARRLLANGLLEVTGRSAGPRGKPKTLLQVSPRSHLAAGVHLDPWSITVTVVDMFAQPLSRVQLPPPTADPRDDLERVHVALSTLLEELGTDQGKGALLGVGIASPGGIDANTGLVVSPPWMPGWRDVPVVRILSDALGVPAVLDKDTTAALTGERWTRRLPPEEVVLYLYLGSGPGSALATGGRLHRGSHGSAGEIGHLPTGIGDDPCGCGLRGCLWLYTDVAGMLAQAREHGVVGPADEMPATEALARLAAAADAEVGWAQDLFHTAGEALGGALQTLINIHDPHRVIIGGPSWHLLEPLAFPTVVEQVARGRDLSRTPVIESSHLGDEVGAIGAATLVLEHELDPVSARSR
jgi:predicted NBD/HSP70 family sugar kinase